MLPVTVAAKLEGAQSPVAVKSAPGAGMACRREVAVASAPLVPAEPHWPPPLWMFPIGGRRHPRQRHPHRPDRGVSFPGVPGTKPAELHP